MPKLILQPTRRRNVDGKKENCPNRAVLNPNSLPQPMTYRPLGTKTNKQGDSHADAQDIPTQTEAESAD
jgi:hypothetical protein